MRVDRASLRPYRLSLRRPVITAAARVAERAGTLVWLRADGGHWGVGDAASWPGFGAGAAALAAALAALPQAVAGWPLAALLPVAGQALPPAPAPLPGWPSEVVFALEAAALDVVGQATGASLASLWGAPALAAVATHAQVDSAFAAEQAVAAGHTALKVKIGARPLGDDLLRVAAVRAAVGERIALRLDANGAWPPALAVQAARRLAPFAPAWLEQPVAAADVAGLAHVRREGGVPVAADEAVTGAAALAALLAAGAADWVVLKPMYVGGLAAARAMAQAARCAGVPHIVTHALESAVGRAVTCHLAAALPGAQPDAPAHGLSDPAARDVARPVGGTAAGPARVAVRPGAHFGLALAAP